jgi:hypothetical protein
MKGLAKLLLGVILGVAGLGTIGFIGIRTGHITIILGDHNKVDNRDQPETAQPAKPIASEVKREPAASQPSTPSPVEPAIEEVAQQPRPTAELAHSRRTLSLPEYEADEECSCPVDTEPQPQPDPPRWVRTQPAKTASPTFVSTAPETSYDAQSSASSEAFVNGRRSVSVSTTTINGQVTRRRVVVNGRVVVDE